VHVVEPKAIIIAETRTMSAGVDNMLKAIGVQHWDGKNSPSTPGERLVEIAGRLCYKSFEVGLNPNVTKVREGNKEYIGNILKQKHGSVLEHSSTTVAFIGVSRIFTHELCRHRAGTAFSQESMRYVRMEDVGMYIPDCIQGADRQLFQDAVSYAEDYYKNLSKAMIKDDMPFHEKKAITSALRRIAPGGHTTNIIMTANHRAWRHMIELRTAEGAEEEIRKVFDNVAHQFRELYPAFYQDMHLNTNGTVTFENSKI
jgi:thymidylate synthase (FAD)